MDFSKYDPLQQKKKKSAINQSITHLEKGFTSADYDDHSQAPGLHSCDPLSDRSGTDPSASHSVIHTQPWMTSAPVILLIEYLRKHPDQGIILYEREGMSGLRFKPGINTADMMNGRAQIAMNMFGLLQDAKDDLKSMIVNNIDVPLLIHLKPKKKKL